MPCTCQPRRGAAHPEYQSRQCSRLTALRAAHPDALSATEARSFVAKSLTSFYRWLHTHLIRPIVKTAYLTLYARADLLAALTRPPPPPDELAARRVVKRASECALQGAGREKRRGHVA